MTGQSPDRDLGLETVRHSKGYVLSGGERRRVEIARSLVIEPSFLLLDEPFSGIDPIQVLELQKIIFDLKNSGIGILVTDHNVRETLAVTDRAYIINNGRIFRSGSPGSVRQRSRSAPRVPGRELQSGVAELGAGRCLPRKDRRLRIKPLEAIKRRRRPRPVRPASWRSATRSWTSRPAHGVLLPERSVG